MGRIALFIYICCMLPHFVQAQNPVLEAYIQTGLEGNQALRQRKLDYSRSLLALKEARGLFYPEISVNARYTVADGGRIIAFPVGDLLNPVYSTLNLLTMSNQFPEIENQEFSFYRPTEHETKVSLVQPIYSSDLIANVKIKNDMVELSRVDMEQYKHELVREIKTAYYNYQKTFYISSLVDSTLLLVRENLRVSESLYKNDLVTKDVVYRSEGEVSMVEAERAKALALQESARAYFNFLLNRSLDEPVELYQEMPKALVLSLEDAQEQAVAKRDELEFIRKNQGLNEHLLGLQKGRATPDLYGAVNYGFQGEEYSFTSEDDFVLASLVLKWDLFQGFSNRNKIRQTKIEAERLDEILSETEMKIRMQVISEYYAAIAAYDAIVAAEKRELSARKAFRLIARKYYEGQASLLEYIDARTNYTNAGSNLIIARNDYFIGLANLEFASANIELE